MKAALAERPFLAETELPQPAAPRPRCGQTLCAPQRLLGEASAVDRLVRACTGRRDRALSSLRLTAFRKRIN